MATGEEISAANHVLWTHRAGGYRPGSFVEALLDAWRRADAENALRLALAFPVYGRMIDLGQTEAGRERLKKIAKGEG